jgi:hypothetical protein
LPATGKTRVGIRQDAVSRTLRENESFRFCVKPGELAAEFTTNGKLDEKARLDELEKRNRANASHESDFSVPLYNVWKQHAKSPGSEIFGNSEFAYPVVSASHQILGSAFGGQLRNVLCPTNKFIGCRCAASSKAE